MEMDDEENPLYNPEVIGALDNLQDDENDAMRRWLVLGGMDLRERDAIYAVGFLHALLLQERTAENISKTTGLLLGDDGGLFFGRNGLISDQAIVVICDFLRRTTDLPALYVKDLPPNQLHRILTALQTNTSVKELRIMKESRMDDPELGERITTLLHDRSDFHVLHFIGDYDEVPEFPFSQAIHGLQHLRKLRFHNCALQDHQVESIVQALVDGNHKHRLEELDLSWNEIAGRGLRALCALAPSSFTRLQKLILDENAGLFDDRDIVQQFVREFLLSPNAILKELGVGWCNIYASEKKGFAFLLKALGTNRTLRRLDVTDSLIGYDYDDNDDDDEGSVQPTWRRNLYHLVENLPKMNGIRELTCSLQEFDDEDQELIVSSIRRNTSLRTLSTPTDRPFTTPAVAAILKRNEYLALLDDLLGTTVSTTPSLRATAGTVAVSRTATATSTSVTHAFIIPQGLWPRILETVAGQGDEGASPVFKILQARLASWPESHNNSNKRKRPASTTLKP